MSLNATTDAVRTQIMPINKAYPIDTLLAACRAFPLALRQRITFEYVLLREVNDTLADARRLVTLMHGLRCKINLLPLMKSPEYPIVVRVTTPCNSFKIICCNMASRRSCGRVVGVIFPPPAGNCSLRNASRHN